MFQAENILLIYLAGNYTMVGCALLILKSISDGLTSDVNAKDSLVSHYFATALPLWSVIAALDKRGCGRG